MLSVITTLKNRADLLYYGLSSIIRQTAFHNILSKIEINIGDGGSSDNIDDVLESISYHNRVVINKWVIDRNRSSYKHILNCPAEEYNILVKLSKYDYILKIDPEFVIITPDFVGRAISQLQTGQPKLIMPLPHHVYDFDYKSLDDIKNNYEKYEYKTHITSGTAHDTNVYYGCMFPKNAFIKLGGIDIRFLKFIGSEDGHFIERWKRTYGPNVHTFIDCHGVHLWHGRWGKALPRYLKNDIEMGAKLKKKLMGRNPNNGDLSSVRFPENIPKAVWMNGKRVE